MRIPGPPFRVAVFNDSATVRAALRATLGPLPDFEIVAEAEDGDDAARVCTEARADFVLMDVVMPTRNGFDAAREIMAVRRIPIVIVSNMVDAHDPRTVFEAMRVGALFVLEPPSATADAQGRRERAAFVQTLRNVAAASRGTEPPPSPPAGARPAEAPRRSALDAIGICASAGGPAAVIEVLQGLPRGSVMPPILLVQHLARGFSESYASWLTTETGRPVTIPRDGEPLSRGVTYLAPDDHHLRYGSGGRVKLGDDPPEQGFRPAGNQLLRSLAVLGARAVGVVLSGMGSDGAEGAAALRRAGGRVVVQDRATSGVYGMPQAALRAGGADDVMPPADIGRWLVRVSEVAP